MQRRIVALCGFSGVGKDSVAAILVRDHGFVRLSVASVLKDVVSVLFGWDRNLVEGATPESRAWRERTDEHWARALRMPGFTPRAALQRVGTDVMRRHFSEDIWLEAMLRRLDTTQGDVVVSDARFLNEIDALVERGAQVWQVNRGQPIWPLELGRRAAAGEAEAQADLARLMVHPSEYGFLRFAPDECIDNSGTLEELRLTVTRLVDV
jgi:hypothetical protein